MSPETRCRCKGLAKSYGRLKVLNDCSLDIAPGELVGLVGENGSGKTTLVRCLLGFTRPSAGTIEIGGRIGYCPQESFLNRSFTVREHLGFVQRVYGRHDEVDPDYLSGLVDRMRLREYETRLIRDLSEGTRQKLQFVTAIMHRPDLVLMDEPYSGFDWSMYLAFWEVVEELCAGGAAVLLVTHFVYDRQRFERIHELIEGKLHVSG
jgi:ABC-type multidrug transport system ATPase subunit